MKERIPDSIIYRGVPIEERNPQPQIRQIAETNLDWDYSNEAKKLYRRADVIIDRLYPVIHTPHFRGRLPSVLIAVDTLRNQKVLAAYRLVPDEYGLNFKITLNQQHYEDKEVEGNKTKAWRWGEWAQMETLVHEIGHHWQQMLGANPYKPTSRVTHNKEFCDKMKQSAFIARLKAITRRLRIETHRLELKWPNGELNHLTEYQKASLQFIGLETFLEAGRGRADQRYQSGVANAHII